jgi:hypothetical protein
MNLVVVVIALFAYGLFYLPVYLPLLVSLLVRPDRRELRISLRLASLALFLLLLIRPERHHEPRPDFGNDVAGNIRGAEYYMAHDFQQDLIWNISWVWGGGLLCVTIACAAAWWLRTRRKHLHFSPV